MIIVESHSEKEQFLEYWNNETSLIMPIWEDLERHPMTSDISFLYVAFENLHRRLTLCIKTPQQDVEIRRH